jgi:hypothetical protein
VSQDFTTLALLTAVVGFAPEVKNGTVKTLLNLLVTFFTHLKIQQIYKTLKINKELTIKTFSLVLAGSLSQNQMSY